MADVKAHASYSSIVGPKLLTIIIGIGLLLASFSQFWEFYRNESVGNALVGMLLFSAALFVGSLHVRTKLDESAIFFTLSNIWRKNIPLSEIRDLEASKQYLAAGYGWRWLGPGVVGYMVGGPCVSIRLTNGKEYIVSTEDPQDLVATFQQNRSPGGIEI